MEPTKQQERAVYRGGRSQIGSVLLKPEQQISAGQIWGLLSQAQQELFQQTLVQIGHSLIEQAGGRAIEEVSDER